MGSVDSEINATLKEEVQIVDVAVTAKLCRYILMNFLSHLPRSRSSPTKVPGIVLQVTVPPAHKHAASGYGAQLIDIIHLSVRGMHEDDAEGEMAGSNRRK